MADSSKTSLQEVTKELYKKNLELVNANKEMALLQKLYETMALKLNSYELSLEFIETIVKQMDFQGGIVYLRQPGTKSLVRSALYFRKNEDKIKLSLRNPQTSRTSITQENNIIAEAYTEQRKKATKHLQECFSIHISEEVVEDIVELGELQSVIALPLSFGQHKIGVMAIFLKQGVDNLSDFENEVMKRVALVFGVALDRVMIYQDLRVANKELKELDKLKDEFVSIASHELRTPLTAIKGYLWLALNKSPKPLAKEVKENLTVALDSNERLARLVEDMLTISRIESNRIKIEPTEFDANELMQDIHKELMIKAQNKNITFTTALPSKVTKVKWDRDRIREVVTNLVGNALKFTPEKGSVTLELATKEGRAIIKVIDSGPGISDDDQQKLFQKFSRLENSYEKTKESGSGLGLYISKQIVDLHSGEIGLQSILGKGATFSVTLPLHPKMKAQ